MAEDDFAVVVLDLAQGDKAAPLSGRAGGVAGNLESLRVEIKAGLRIGHQNTFGLPLLQGSSGARVHVLLVIVAGLRLAQNHAHQVIRAGCVILLLHCRGDFVVGLGHNIGGRHLRRVIPQSLKRKNICHKSSRLP